jgi:hypothetical protein
MKQQRPQDYYGSNLRGLPNKNKARFDYNYQQRNRRNVMTYQQKKSRDFGHIESKIKDRIQNDKRMSMNPAAAHRFDKTPQVFFKPQP